MIEVKKTTYDAEGIEEPCYEVTNGFTKVSLLRYVLSNTSGWDFIYPKTVGCSLLIIPTSTALELLQFFV